MRGQLCDAPIETASRLEGAEPERAVHVLRRFAGAECRLALRQKSRGRHFMFALQVRVPRESSRAGIVGVGHFAEIVGVGLAAELAHQHFAPPMIILRWNTDRRAGRDQVAAAVVLGHRQRILDHFVEGRGRLSIGCSGLAEQFLVIEQPKASHRRGNRPIALVRLHHLHEVEIFAIHIGRLEIIRRQRLDELRLRVFAHPSEEELHHRRPFACRHGRGGFRPVLRVGEMRVLDLDARIGGFELLDERVDGLDTFLEEILPIIDLDRLCPQDRGRGDQKPRCRCAGCQCASGKSGALRIVRHGDVSLVMM